MKNAIKHELKKMLASRNWKISLLLGAIIVIAHFVSVAQYVDWAYYTDLPQAHHPTGLDSISLLVLFLPGDSWFITATLFYFVLPILAAFPFSSSLHKERKSGYQLQVIAHTGKKRYMAAKLLACALSGFMTIFALLLLDVMLCACIAPLVPVHVLSLISAVGQGYFASPLFFSHPLLYIAVCILMSSLWGAVCAVVALAAEMLVSNSFLITVFPFLLFLALTAAFEFLDGSVFKASYEIRPIFLMRAAWGDPNPSWYIALWQCVYALAAVMLYYWKGMKRENL